MDEYGESSLIFREDVFESIEDTMNSIGIQIFFFLMKMYTHFKKWYNTSEWVQRLCKINTHVNGIFYPYEIEPVKDSWKCVLWIDKQKLHQTYIESSEEDVMTDYKQLVRNCKEDVSKDESPIVVMKTHDGYYCNVLTELYKDPRLYLSDQPRELSKVRFISVNYIYGEDSEKSVPLEVNRGFYMTGNHLFNATFVYRALKYQSLPFEFTLTYTLQIIDDSANYFELKSDQYVHIEKDEYVVKKTDSTTDSD